MRAGPNGRYPPPLNPQGKILIGAGDVGGARAVLPALRELEKRGRDFDLLDHGLIVKEAPSHWPRVSVPQNDSAFQEILSAKYSAYAFGTSVSDSYPLRIARMARAGGVPVVCVLDNWMNYRKRLETDGEPMLVPDAYAAMDDLARDEAIADGVPADCLRLVGHPAISSLADDYLASSLETERGETLQHSGLPADGKRLIVFVSEPAEQDQGADARSPGFRGYHEKSVLRLLSRCLQPFHERIQVGLVPHPREDVRQLLAHWEVCRGKLQGGQLAVKSGRHAVFIADGVCGMASLLLYEALLLGKPVLSLQPGLRLSQLEFLRKKGVEAFVTEESVAPERITAWVEETISRASSSAPPLFHSEMDLHRYSPSRLADLLERPLPSPPPLRKAEK